MNIVQKAGRALRRRAFVAVGLAWLTAGCGGDTPTAPTDTTASVPAVTETLEGRVGVNGAAVHPFAVEVAGTVVATLSAVEPADAVIGVSLGTWTASTNVCRTILANDAAVLGSTIVGTASVSGTFCIRLNDVGKLTEPATYSVTVTHY